MARFSAGTLLLGIIAVMFGLLSAYIVRKELHKPQPVVQAETAPAPQSFVVPRASTDLEEGRQLTLGDISIYRMTVDHLREEGIANAFMNSTEQIIGRVLRAKLAKGETFDTDLFYPEGTGPSVAEKLETGERAVTVTIEGPAAVAGFASPGSMVDVLFRAEEDEDKELPQTTITLLEGVRVLAFNNQTFQATARNTQPARNDTALVTLAVSPDEAAALRVVEGRGLLSLSLRNPGDVDVFAGTQPRTLDELLERPNNKYKMEIYRGRSLTQVEFKKGERLTPTPATEQLATRPTSAPVPPAPPENTN